MTTREEAIAARFATALTGVEAMTAVVHAFAREARTLPPADRAVVLDVTRRVIDQGLPASELGQFKVEAQERRRESGVHPLHDSNKIRDFATAGRDLPEFALHVRVEGLGHAEVAVHVSPSVGGSDTPTVGAPGAVAPVTAPGNPSGGAP